MFKGGRGGGYCAVKSTVAVRDIEIPQTCQDDAHIGLRTTEYRLAAKVEEGGVDKITASKPSSSPEELRLEASFISNCVGRPSRELATC